MGETSKNEEQYQAVDNENVNTCEATNLQEERPNTAEENLSDDNVTDEFEVMKKKYDDISDSYIRLMAEFDNYRKRTLKEKAELIKSGGEGIILNLLPVVDDFERAIQMIQSAGEKNAIGEGVELIYNKFMSFLSQQGVKPIQAVGEPFDTELYEAIATLPAPDEALKGRVLDCVQTGYTMYDKVIRHAKVAVGE